MLDQARVFARQPERLEAMSARLAGLAERHGMEVRVALFDSLIGSSASEQAQWLRDAWLTEGPGVVLVVECDSGRYDLSWTETAEVTSETGESMPLVSEGDLSAGDRLRVEQSLAGIERAGTNRGDGAEALVNALAESIDRRFVRASLPPDPSRMLKLFAVGTGLLAAMLLVGMLVAALMRRGERPRDAGRYFPKVTVGMRLGAPCGGGKVSARTFGAAPPRKP